MAFRARTRTSSAWRSCSRPSIERPARARSPRGTHAPHRWRRGPVGGHRRGNQRLPGSVPRARLVDWEIAAVNVFTEGLLMAPAYAIPRMLARNDVAYHDIALWEIHEAFAAQVLCNVAALESADFRRQKAGVEANLGKFPWERLNPHGGSVALGHPFGATGARILSQAVKELAAMPKGSRAVVSICADGGWAPSRCYRQNDSRNEIRNGKSRRDLRRRILLRLEKAAEGPEPQDSARQACRDPGCKRLGEIDVASPDRRPGETGSRTVKVAGETVHELDTHALYALRRKMGMMFQAEGYSPISRCSRTSPSDARAHRAPGKRAAQDRADEAARGRPARRAGAGAGRAFRGDGAPAWRLALAIAEWIRFSASVRRAFGGLDPISINVIANLIRQLNDSPRRDLRSW